MRDARLNVFQRLARTWDAVHPYNAGQACRLAGQFERDATAEAWRDTVRSFGFESPAHQVISLDKPADLGRHFTLELNRPFDADDSAPFRPFVQRAGGSTWLGITYSHWMADSVSIRLLLRAWLERLTGAEHCSHTAAVGSPQRGRIALPSLETLLALLRRYGDYRRSRKVHTMGPLDNAVRVTLLPTPRSSVRSLARYARDRGVKVNDVFLAALAEACEHLVPTQHRIGRRHLAVSAIVDLRRVLPRDERASFGCHLGFSSVVCAPRHLQNWNALLRNIAAQNAVQRRAGVARSSIAWMQAAEAATSTTSPSRLYDFYRKEAPFAGGISNVNLNDTWFAKQHAAGRILDYIRVSPTGPMVPVVLNVTTLGDELRLSMTYRSNLLNDWTAEEIAEMFSRRIAGVAIS